MPVVLLVRGVADPDAPGKGGQALTREEFLRRFYPKRYRAMRLRRRLARQKGKGK